jgi:hypothetical protein
MASLRVSQFISILCNSIDIFQPHPDTIFVSLIVVCSDQVESIKRATVDTDTDHHVQIDP